MSQTDTTAIKEEIIALPYEQQLSIISFVIDNLKNSYIDKDSVVMLDVPKEYIDSKLKESFSSLEKGDVISEEEVESRFQEKFAL